MATLLWFSGCELGSAKEFNGGLSSSAAVVGSPVRTGDYSLEITPGDEAGHRIVSPTAEWYYRGYVYVTGVPSKQTIIWTFGSTFGFYGLMWNTDGTLSYTNDLFSAAETGPDSLVPNDWNIVEVKFVRSSSVGGMELYLNGELQFSHFTDSTTFGTSTAQVTLTWESYDTDFDVGGGTLHWDDMAFGTGGYIGAGKSLKFQGKAGAPTYDAWAKSSGSDAYALWSDTPYDVSTYCTSATSAQKQTMLVEALTGVSGTINGCLLKAIAKVSTGFSTIKTLRRIAATDTLSSALSTATTERAVPNGLNGESESVFVASVSDLEAGEIGVECEATGPTTTVYDVYLLVDFVGAAPVPVERLAALPYEFLGGSDLTRRAALPYEFLGTFVGRRAALPIEWDGEDPDAFRLRWVVVGARRADAIGVPTLHLRWVVLANELPAPHLRLRWEVSRHASRVRYVWRVLAPDVRASHVDDVQLPIAEAEITRDNE